MIVTILIIANQNSISPKSFTATMLRQVSSKTIHVAGIHLSRLGNQAARYPHIAIVSALPMTTQHIQYVHPM